MCGFDLSTAVTAAAHWYLHFMPFIPNPPREHQVAARTFLIPLSIIGMIFVRVGDMMESCREVRQ